MIIDCILSPREYQFLRAADNYIAVLIKVFRSGETVFTALDQGANSVEIRPQSLLEHTKKENEVFIGNNKGS